MRLHGNVAAAGEGFASVLRLLDTNGVFQARSERSSRTGSGVAHSIHKIHGKRSSKREQAQPTPTRSA